MDYPPMSRREFIKTLFYATASIALGIGTPGCIEEIEEEKSEKTKIVKLNDTAYSIDSNLIRTSGDHSYPTELKIETEESLFGKYKYLIIKGKVIGVDLNEGLSEIIFEDGTVLPCYFAEQFIWKLGKIYEIKVKISYNDYMIKEIKCVDCTDSK